MANQNLIDKVKTYWETCAFKYAHITTHEGKDIFAGSVTEGIYKNCFIDLVDWKEKTVIDYGCGGGFVGKYLFEKCGIKKYIGVDIADRSIDAAKKTIAGDAEFHLVPIELKNIRADILICLAVIQHFPTIKYLDEFLLNINKSGIDTIVLQIRHADRSVCNNAYDNAGNVGLACLTNQEHLEFKLTNYKTISVKRHDPLNYEYITLVKNGI